MAFLTIMTAVYDSLSLGEGLTLTLSAAPPPPSLFKVVMVTEGRGRWAAGDRERSLERSSPWWSGQDTGDQAWVGEGSTRWLCLSGDRCPVPSFDETFYRLSAPGEPRCCAAAAADARELAQIITDCPFSCELKTLMARGKSLMLVSKVLHSLEHPEPEPSDYGVRFFRSDLDRLRSAREILISRMADPPSLAELAREAGLNEVKLKAGFRKLWGTTVYGLLRQERMAEARRFLEAAEGNVGEAAFRVGFTNTSHFAQAFQKEFGVTPGTVARSRS